MYLCMHFKKRNVRMQDVILYYRYVNGVKPGPYGIHQPFYFPFLPSYWIGHKARTEEVQSLQEPICAVYAVHPAFSNSD